MKGTWITIITVTLTCLCLTALPLQTQAQQDLDDPTADMPLDDTDEEFPPLEEDPESLPLDDEQALDGEPPFEDEPSVYSEPPLEGEQPLYGEPPVEDDQPADGELPLDDDYQQSDYQIPGDRPMDGDFSPNDDLQQSDYQPLENDEDAFGTQQMAPASAAPAQTGRIVTPNALQHCNTAVTNPIFNLKIGGIDPGVTYIKAGTSVGFQAPIHASHDIQIFPNGFLASNKFRVVRGSKLVVVKSSTPGKVARGRISVNPSNNETEHYVVICP